MFPFVKRVGTDFWAFSVGSVENLCLMMNLLRDEARSIQFEAGAYTRPLLSST